MQEVLTKIAQADAYEAEVLLKAIWKRYEILFPDWEVSILTLQKSADRNVQLDRIIAMLEKRKTSSCELPQFVRTAQKDPYVGNFKFYAEWRSISGATPVLFWMRSWL